MNVVVTALLFQHALAPNTHSSLPLRLSLIEGKPCMIPEYTESNSNQLSYPILYSIDLHSGDSITILAKFRSKSFAEKSLTIRTQIADLFPNVIGNVGETQIEFDRH